MHDRLALDYGTALIGFRTDPDIVAMHRIAG